MDIQEQLISACRNGHLETVKYLVKVGADITAQNNWAVRLASKKGSTRCGKIPCQKQSRCYSSR